MLRNPMPNRDLELELFVRSGRVNESVVKRHISNGILQCMKSLMLSGISQMQR